MKSDTKSGSRVLRFAVSGALFVTPLAGCGTTNAEPETVETINEPPQEVETTNEPAPEEEHPAEVNEPLEDE